MRGWLPTPGGGRLAGKGWQEKSVAPKGVQRVAGCKQMSSQASARYGALFTVLDPGLGLCLAIA